MQLDLANGRSSHTYIKPFTYWDGGCKAVCKELYGPCLVSENWHSFKKAYHCIPDFYNEKAGIIEMKFSISALRTSLGQLERFRKITGRITYWVYHDFPNRQHYENRFGVRILVCSEILSLVKNSGNKRAGEIAASLFQDETTIQKSDFWTKHMVEKFFSEKILPKSGVPIPADRGFYFRNGFVDWYNAVESMRKGYFGLEDFAIKNGIRMEGATNLATTADGGRRFVPVLKFRVRGDLDFGDQWKTIERLTGEIAELQEKFWLGGGILFANKKVWGGSSSKSPTRSNTYYCFFPEDLLDGHFIARFYGGCLKAIGTQMDQKFLDKSLHLAKSGQPVNLRSTLGYNPEDVWYVKCVKPAKPRPYVKLDKQSVEFCRKSELFKRMPPLGKNDGRRDIPELFEFATVAHFPELEISRRSEDLRVRLANGGEKPERGLSAVITCFKSSVNRA